MNDWCYPPYSYCETHTKKVSLFIAFLILSLLLIMYFGLCAYIFYAVWEEKAPEREQLRDKQNETKIMHGVSTLQGSKAFQRLARLHWAAAVV